MEGRAPPVPSLVTALHASSNTVAQRSEHTRAHKIGKLGMGQTEKNFHAGSALSLEITAEWPCAEKASTKP